MPDLRPPVTSLRAESTGFARAPSVGAAPPVASSLDRWSVSGLTAGTVRRSNNLHCVLHVVENAGHFIDVFGVYCMAVQSFVMTTIDFVFEWYVVSVGKNVQSSLHQSSPRNPASQLERRERQTTAVPRKALWV